MQAMRRIAAADVAIEHHAVRFGHQHPASMTLDHRFDVICPLLRCTLAIWTAPGRLLAEAFEEHPNQRRDDRQKNYFSHLPGPCLEGTERDDIIIYLIADNLVRASRGINAAIFPRTRVQSQSGQATPCALRNNRASPAIPSCRSAFPDYRRS